MAHELKGQTGMVMGASGCIGSAVTRLLASEGMDLVLAGRSHAPLVRCGETLPPSVQPLICQVDASDPNAIREVVRDVIGQFGRLDVYIHCAGSFTAAPADALHAREIECLMRENVHAVLHAATAVLPIFRQQKGGHFIVVGSLAALIPMPFAAAYAAAKAAVRAFCLSLAEELRDSGVVVSLITPGPVRSPMLTRESAEEQCCATFALLPCSPEQVAGAVRHALLTAPREIIVPRWTGPFARLFLAWPALEALLHPLIRIAGLRGLRRYRRSVLTQPLFDQLSGVRS